MTQVTTSDSHAEVHYTQDDNGVRVDAAPLKAPLVVAADSRFSAVRRMLGVGTQMTDFGRSVIVCRMRTSVSHEDKAHECFGYDRTLAILPVQPDPDTGELLCSAVVTTDSADAQQLMQLSPEDFAAHVQNHFQSRLGDMQLVGERHIYPWWPPMPTVSAVSVLPCWATPRSACTRSQPTATTWACLAWNA